MSIAADVTGGSNSEAAVADDKAQAATKDLVTNYQEAAQQVEESDEQRQQQQQEKSDQQPSGTSKEAERVQGQPGSATAPLDALLKPGKRLEDLGISQVSWTVASQSAGCACDGCCCCYCRCCFGVRHIIIVVPLLPPANICVAGLSNVMQITKGR